MNLIKRSRFGIAVAAAVALIGGSSSVFASSAGGELGNHIYSEPSDETRAEVLDLLNSQADLSKVFLTGLSMGLPIDEILQASVRNDVDNGQRYLSAAGELLPLVGFNKAEEYLRYPVTDLTDQSAATEVINRFFEKDMRLDEVPDWQVGEYHLMVSASELKALADRYNDGNYWFITDDNSGSPETNRPVFVQLYSEHDYAIINDVSRINSLNAQNPSAQLPVVFVFNGGLERPISQMTQPANVQNIIEDYKQYSLMATPPPEWSLGEYHAMVSVSSLDSYFGLPSEQDVSAEHWSKLLSDIQSNGIRDSFIVSVLANGNSTGGNGDAVLNRADKVAAAKALGYSEVPISYYYADQRRVSPYHSGLRGLGYAAVQAGMPPSILPTPIGVAPITGGNGGISKPVVKPPVKPPEPPTEPETTCECASPPCNNMCM